MRQFVVEDDASVTVGAGTAVVAAAAVAVDEVDAVVDSAVVAKEVAVAAAGCTSG